MVPVRRGFFDIPVILARNDAFPQRRAGEAGCLVQDSKGSDAETQQYCSGLVAKKRVLGRLGTETGRGAGYAPALDLRLIATWRSSSAWLLAMGSPGGTWLAIYRLFLPKAKLPKWGKALSARRT